VEVSSLELFFDLVAVFTLTQLTTLLTDEPDVPAWRRGAQREVG
jgi:low temperature requirement protein LtrA